MICPNCKIEINLNPSLKGCKPDCRGDVHNCLCPKVIDHTLKTIEEMDCKHEWKSVGNLGIKECRQCGLGSDEIGETEI